MSGKSNPLEATSVAIKTSFLDNLNDVIANSLSSWSRESN